MAKTPPAVVVELTEEEMMRLKERADREMRYPSQQASWELKRILLQPIREGM